MSDWPVLPALLYVVRQLLVDFTIPAEASVVVATYLEIGDGVTLELASGATLAIL
jgi:hypothetical protein